jgi:hypothetical protein
MNTELATIFTGEDAEFTCFNTATPCVDVTDWPLTPTLISALTPNPNYYVTSSISETGYFEIQFMLANNFWNCPMNFGNNNTGTNPDCGLQIRQGIAHLVDKVSFTNSQPNIAGVSAPIDNPLPVNNGGLPTPNPCQWDASFNQTGTNCIVGAPGGTAYHLATATFNNGFAFNQPGFGSQDFCAAAQHFINAGLAMGKDANCVLTTINPTVTAHTVNFFIRIDNTPRFQLGQSMAQEICALFGQGFVEPCAPYLTVTPGPITAFPGFITSPTSVNLSWHIYTAGYGATFPFDSSLYFIYNSRFVSGIPTIQMSGGGFCRNDSQPTFSAGNYIYLCYPNYDFLSYIMETAVCLGALGDPVVGQQIASYGFCTATRKTGVVYASGAPAIPNTYDAPQGTTPGNCGPPGAVVVCPEPVITTSGGALPVNGDPIRMDPHLKYLEDLTGGVGGSWNSQPTLGNCVPLGPPAKGCYNLDPAAGGGVGQPWAACGPANSVPGNPFGKTVYYDPLNRGIVNGAIPLCGLGLKTQGTNPPVIPVGKALSKDPLLSTYTSFLSATAQWPVFLIPFCNIFFKCFYPFLSAVSAGYESEYIFGANAFTIPIYVQKDQFGYLGGATHSSGLWQRVINSAGSGIPQFFTWLNAWSANPVQSGTIRQAFKENIKSVSPYIESTVWDAYVFGNIYDSVGISNPASPSQLLNWMGVSLQTINPANSGSLGYTPPSGTSAALRISLRSDMFWQNDNSGSHPAKQVTAYDVAFSYMSLLGSGAFNSGGASPTTGITVINQSTFDFDISALGPFTTLFETGLPVIPGQYWSGAGQSTWNTSVDNTVSTCSHQPTASAVVGCFRAQYTLDPTAKIGTSTVPVVDCADSAILSGASGCTHIPGSLLNVDTTKITATYDPVANGILIGSSAWEAVTNGVVGGGTGVTPCGAMVCSTSPTYTLQRYGSVASITAAGCGVSDHYFRSNCTLGIWTWSGDNGEFTHDFSSELQVVRACNAVTPVPAQCVHWTKGIAGSGGSAITSVQIGAVNRFVAVNWVGGTPSAPFNWNTNPPTGLVAFAPVLYDGPTTTLNPCSIDAVNGYDC